LRYRLFDIAVAGRGRYRRGGGGVRQNPGSVESPQNSGVLGVDNLSL